MNLGLDNLQLNQQASTALYVKLLQLQRDGLSRLTLEQLIDTIKGLRWKKQQPSTLCEMVDDILKTGKDEIVIYLSKKAIIDGYSLKISDFADLIGGKEHE